MREEPPLRVVRAAQRYGLAQHLVWAIIWHESRRASLITVHAGGVPDVGLVPPATRLATYGRALVGYLVRPACQVADVGPGNGGAVALCGPGPLCRWKREYGDAVRAMYRRW